MKPLRPHSQGNKIAAWKEEQEKHMKESPDKNGATVDQDARWIEIQALSRKVASKDGTPTEIEAALCGAVVRAREWLEELEATKELLVERRPPTRQFVDRGDAVNLAFNIMGADGRYGTVTDKGVKSLADAVLRMDEALKESAPSSAEQKLDKPAQIGGTRFGVGIKWSTVIARAQREYEYKVTPEKEEARIARSKEAMAGLGKKYGGFDSCPYCGGTEFAAQPSATEPRVAAALHACEGLDTSDLAGNSKGWLSEVVHAAASVESDLKRALRACCAGNTDDDEPVRCQSYEASEQSQPCPRGRCVMAEPDCPECNGAGTVAAMTTHLGPDDHTYDAECPKCGGTGAASAIAPSHAQRMVDKQARDTGLWFDADYAPEAYLQRSLRELHAAVEADTARRTERAAK